MVVGRINHPLIAEDIIKSGKADMVCMGRGLLADPEMPKKALEGRLDDIRTCIACNTCIESIFKKGHVECLVNPSLGREEEMAIRPAVRRKKVMVVGGGPGGMNFAWIAAQRGHEVHLFDKQSRLGGQLLQYGCVNNYKADLKSLIEFQTNQITKAGVITHLNQEAGVATVMDQNPDVIVLATGSSPGFPDVPGIDSKIVFSFWEMFRDPPEPSCATVVIGGGPTGCEIAHYIAERGNPVTIVEMLPKIGSSFESRTRKVLLGKLNEKGVRMMAGYRLLKVEKNGVRIKGADGDELFVEAEKVVIAIGGRSDEALYERIKHLDFDIHRIGDCMEPRDAKAAIFDGAVLARSI
jgi:NADPH-dependent 2,4-dienoyl-CoA reductase/sulfur reductase-like enzyme